MSICLVDKPMATFHWVFVWITFMLLFSHIVSCTRINRTIDDEYGDSVTGQKPIYTPADQFNYGPTCPECSVQPDIDVIFDHTWHDATCTPKDPQFRTVTLLFNGTAVWVYCIVPNYVHGTKTFMNLSFELDGNIVGEYVHYPNKSTTSFEYNVSVYSNTSLENVQHELAFALQHNGNDSYIGFDWAMYTYEDDDDNAPTSTTTIDSPATIYSSTSSHTSRTTGVAAPNPPSSESHPSVGDIVGGAVAGLAILILVVIVILYACRRGKMRRVPGQDEPTVDEPVGFTFVPCSNLANSKHLSPSLRFSSLATTGDPHVTASYSTISMATNNGDAETSNSAAIPPSALLSTVGTIRREELSRQMRDIEEHVIELRRHQSSLSIRASRHAPVHSVPPSLSSRVPRGEQYDDSQLRLQMEMERLAEVAAADAQPPPAYSDEENGATEAI